MKLKCHNCEKALQVPDEWAGRKIKCPSCKAVIELPKTLGGDGGAGLDLGALSALEAGGEVVVPDRKGKPMSLKEAQAAAAAARAAQQQEVGPTRQDPTLRICPQCKAKVRSQDLYSEVICGHCGGPVPGLAIASDSAAKYKKSAAEMAPVLTTFYGGFTGAATYPIPALGSIGAGMAIALGSIAIPLLIILGFIASAGLNPINEKDGQTDYGWVGIFITVAFCAQGLYFGSVGYFILIDTIRTTKSGNEQPPNLTWNVINLGAALGGYVALIGMYVLVIVILVTLSQAFPASLDDFAVLSRPINLIVLSLITFGVPMNMIGLSSSHAMDGLHPVKVSKSMLATLGHYIFLFLITLLYLGIYVGIMAAVLNWAGPKIMAAAKHGLGAGFTQMLLGLVAWSVVIGAGFYFSYSIGRILGLFTRTYREKLDFEL